MSIVENYNSALQAIYDHVGFVENWVIYPINDNTDKVWDIIDGEEVHFADSIEEFENEEGNFYTAEIYKQRFYSKHVYEGKDFTMIFDTQHVDGMIYFSLYDNKKKYANI